MIPFYMFVNHLNIWLDARQVEAPTFVCIVFSQLWGLLCCVVVFAELC